MEAVRLSCVLHSEYDTAIHQRDEARARVAELEAERTQLLQELAEARAEVERLTWVTEEAGVQLERLTRNNAELVLLALGPQESNPGPDAPSQERATGEFAAQVLTLSEATSATIREGQTNRNAALRQRVFEHLGALILNEKAGWGGLPDLVAQFDLLGRDL